MTSDPRIDGQAKLKVADQHQLVNRYIVYSTYLYALVTQLVSQESQKSIAICLSFFTKQKELASDLAKNFVHNVKTKAKQEDTSKPFMLVTVVATSNYLPW